jgi:hypothetical protein
LSSHKLKNSRGDKHFFNFIFLPSVFSVTSVADRK